MALNPGYSGVNLPGADGLRIPTERGGFIPKTTQTQPSVQTYGELDLGTVAVSPYNLNAQQAGASYITVNPTVALTINFPVCQAGQLTIVKNTNATNAITMAVTGNANTATVALSSVAAVVQDGLTGGVTLVSGT